MLSYSFPFPCSNSMPRDFALGFPIISFQFYLVAKSPGCHNKEFQLLFHENEGGHSQLLIYEQCRNSDMNISQSVAADGLTLNANVSTRGRKAPLDGFLSNSVDKKFIKDIEWPRKKILQPDT